MTNAIPAPTRHELRTRMDLGLQKLLAVLDQLSDNEMLEPKDAAGWNVRDHVTHLAVWADGIAALLRREGRWAAMGLSMVDPISGELDYDALNEQIVVQHRQRSPAEARAMLVAAHERVAEAVEALTDADLAAPYDRFVAPFTGDWGQPVWGYVAGNTMGHYDEHLPWLPRSGAGKTGDGGST